MDLRIVRPSLIGPPTSSQPNDTNKNDLMGHLIRFCSKLGLVPSLPPSSSTSTFLAYTDLHMVPSDVVTRAMDRTNESDLEIITTVSAAGPRIHDIFNAIAESDNSVVITDEAQWRTSLKALLSEMKESDERELKAIGQLILNMKFCTSQQQNVVGKGNASASRQRFNNNNNGDATDYDYQYQTCCSPMNVVRAYIKDK
eukprot:PhM_4_TR18086/c0_g1_i2/m.102016